MAGEVTLNLALSAAFVLFATVAAVLGAIEFLRDWAADRAVIGGKPNRPAGRGDRDRERGASLDLES